jgi:peptide/nickel transport system substrate-binding protein/microcin C transport system substrate-binding protein
MSRPSPPALHRACGRGRRLAAVAILSSLLAGGHAAMHPLPAAPPTSAPAMETPWVHAYASYGQPKYPPGFDHFDYVNPAAPKGGVLYLRNPDRRANFDKFNYYTLRGNAPVGVQILMMEQLAIVSADEPQTMYGLLAESMQIAPDKSWIAFRLNRKARFNNGDRVTAEDVKWTFDQLSSPYADPQYQNETKGVAERVSVVDERTVRFDMKDRSNDGLFTIAKLRVFSRKWGLKPDGTHKRFDEIVTEYPISTGPYLIAAADSGRRLEFRRDPNYWGRELGVRRGFFNFDRIVYRYYRDGAIAREAFKAGEFDLYKEYSAAAWVRLDKGAKWDDGRIVKDPFPTHVGQGMQSLYFNLRRDRFKDIRVREALELSYDFDTGAQRYNLFKRASSVFNNSPFAAEGPPSPAELRLLEPFRAELPPAVFGPAYVAPATGGEPARLRANLLKARALLEQAGWKLASDGKLRNAQGEAFLVEYLSANEGSRMPDWELNLRKLGIELKIRSVDYALYQRRLEEFDFDMVTIVEGDFTLPHIADLVQTYGSKAADQKGSDNLRGVKSRAVDALLLAMSRAATLDELRDAARALDRVVMWSHWQIPELYTNDERVNYWNRFGLPATRPLYYTLESALVELPPWAVIAWWQVRPPSR